MRNVLSEMIRRERKAVGLTQAQLASMAGVGLRCLREMEHGKPSSRMDKVNEVLAFFGTQLGAVSIEREARDDH
jgi:y4mF family transcriptional regulator